MDFDPSNVDDKYTSCGFDGSSLGYRVSRESATYEVRNLSDRFRIQINTSLGRR